MLIWTLFDSSLCLSKEDLNAKKTVGHRGEYEDVDYGNEQGVELCDNLEVRVFVLL